MAYRLTDKSLALMAKRANQRMLRLERAGLSTPAYEAAQGKLEMMGVKAGKATGRRFSETGRGTFNEREALEKTLREFLNAKTSTVRGFKKLESDIWNKADSKLHLSEAGVSKEDYFKMWKDLPDKGSRRFGSSVYISFVKAYNRKNEKVTVEGRLTASQIAQAVNNSNNFLSALKSVGLTLRDYAKVTK